MSWTVRGPVALLVPKLPVAIGRDAHTTSAGHIIAITSYPPSPMPLQRPQLSSCRPSAAVYDVRPLQDGLR